MAGFGQQSIEWIAENMDAWFNYPRSVDEPGAQVGQWNQAAEKLGMDIKPYITAFHLDLVEDPDADLIPLDLEVNWEETS